jgi:hypothetical protein
MFAAPLRSCLERGEAEVILPGDSVRARLLVARSPATFRSPCSPPMATWTRST